MRNLTIELKKCKRTGILEVLPIIGLLGALYAFANFTVRKDVLLNLPLPPMDVLLTQLYGMIMVLNMFGIIVATTLTYNIEFQGSAIKKMYMLPFKTSSIFKNKFYILFVLLAVCIVLQNGVSYFDGAENAFVSAYRKYKDTLKFDIHIEYIASPRIDDKTLIITDPMLATGGSMELSYQAMLTKGHPAEIHVASIIASQHAIDHIKSVFPEDKTTIWCAAIDPEINEHSYIVPGLGDAGDLAYGEKE